MPPKMNGQLRHLRAIMFKSRHYGNRVPPYAKSTGQQRRHARLIDAHDLRLNTSHAREHELPSSAAMVSADDIDDDSAYAYVTFAIPHEAASSLAWHFT